MKKLVFDEPGGLRKVTKSQESMNIYLEGYVHGFLRLVHFFKAPSSSKTNFFISHREAYSVVKSKEKNTLGSATCGKHVGIYIIKVGFRRTWVLKKWLSLRNPLTCPSRDMLTDS